MNLDQFREIKAKETEASKQTEQTTTTKPVEETKPETKQEESTAPQKFNIPGIGEVDIEELKSGYLRQSDYTKKTQEISTQKNEVKDAVVLYEFMKANPEVAKLVLEKAPQVKGVSKEEQRIRELESEIALQKKNAEIADLTSKDKNFNLVEVEKIMEDRKLHSLSDAYKIWKSDNGKVDLDLESITKKIREDILKELNANVDTRTIVNSKGGEVTSTQPELTAIEKKIAKNLKMSEADYLRHKNIK